jgi:hypothetical protein
MRHRCTLDVAAHSTTAVVRVRAGQAFHQLSCLYPRREIVAPHLPSCATTATYLAEPAVSNMSSLGCGCAVPLSRMQFQHTSSRLPTGVEGHNCRLVLAGYTDYMKDVLLPGRLRWVTKFRGGRSIRKSLTRASSLLTYGVRLASIPDTCRSRDITFAIPTSSTITSNRTGSIDRIHIRCGFFFFFFLVVFL